MNDYLFKYEDAAMRTLYVAPLNNGVAFLIEEGLRMHSVCLSTEAVARLITSLSPVVGDKGGAQIPAVNQTEPGSELSRVGAADAPARASIVDGCSTCPFLGYREAREEYPERSYYWCEQGASVDGFEHGGGAPEVCPLREAPRLVQLAAHRMAQ